MSQKTMLMMAAALCWGGGAMAAGVRTAWFDAVGNYETENAKWSGETVTVEGSAMEFDSQEGVTYTPGGVASQGFSVTLELDAEPIEWDELPAVGAELLKDAHLALCLARRSENPKDLVVAGYAAGQKCWQALDLEPVDDANTISIVYEAAKGEFKLYLGKNEASLRMDQTVKANVPSTMAFVGCGNVTKFSGTTIHSEVSFGDEPTEEELAACQAVADTEAAKYVTEGLLKVSAVKTEGGWVVEPTIDEKKMAVKIDETARAFAKQNLGNLSGASTALIDVKKLTPGLYYSVCYGASHDGLSQETDRVLATDSDIEITVPQLSEGERVRYFKVKASASAK